MKKVNLLMASLLIVLLSVNLMLAQTSAKSDDVVENYLCCHGKGYYNIPDLTDEQKKKIEELQLAHMKEVNQTKALMQEKQAHLRTLQLADKPNNDAINKTIDEITALKNQLMKKHEAYRQGIRSLLTDKQKIVFDAKGCCKHGEKKGCCKHGAGKGCSGSCGGDCKAKGCGHKAEHAGCSSQPVKGKGCCHKK